MLPPAPAPRALHAARHTVSLTYFWICFSVSNLALDAPPPMPPLRHNAGYSSAYMDRLCPCCSAAGGSARCGQGC